MGKVVCQGIGGALVKCAFYAEVFLRGLLNNDNIIKWNAKGS